MLLRTRKPLLILITIILAVAGIFTYMLLKNDKTTQLDGPGKANQKSLVDAKTTNSLDGMKVNDKIDIHKIAGLGDEVLDERTYDQACGMPQSYLDKRYLGILKFELLPSDYKEGNPGVKNSISRYSGWMGGQYSCFFKGTYLKDFPKLKIVDTKNFTMAEFGHVTFSYPDIESFELQQKYNVEKKSGEVFLTTAPAPVAMMPLMELIPDPVPARVRVYAPLMPLAMVSAAAELLANVVTAASTKFTAAVPAPVSPMTTAPAPALTVMPGELVPKVKALTPGVPLMPPSSVVVPVLAKMREVAV